MKYIRKISEYIIVGGVGALAIAGLQGCEKRDQNQNALNEAAQAKGAFVVIDEVAPNSYKIAEEFPSKTTRVILRKLDGTEKILTKEEMDRLIKEEEAKIDEGTSALTNPEYRSSSPGLGEILLSSAAGAILGSYIGRRLFGNQNYQSQRRTNYKSPQVYSKSVDSFNKAKSGMKSSKRTKSSGFFKNRVKRSSSRSFFSFGG